MQIKKSSWHYQFIINHRDLYDGSAGYIPGTTLIPRNFCSYWSLLVKVFITDIIWPIIGMSLMFGLLVVAPVYNAVAFGNYIFLVAIVASFLIVAAAFGIPAYIQHLMRKEPGIIRMRYLAWKNKVCEKVEYVE